MTVPLLDISFLYNLADNDNVYINEVIKLFLDNVPNGLAKLEKAINETDDFEVIQRQAHALKSSAGIIKIRGMYEDLVVIEGLARQQAGKDEMLVKLNSILTNFKEALPLIEAEKKKNEQATKK
jgi:HPt (histidine-containing phosphotransfer) domain-containing protein